MTSTENIILVDPYDQKIGEIEKQLGHQYGMLHRAFSVLVFRLRDEKIETLIQQRSKQKYHSGGLWTNTCCSHPREGENIKIAAEKRLKEEMGIEVELKEVGKFHYVAILDHGMIENEIDHVFIGSYVENDIPFNTSEVENYRWLDIASLEKELACYPSRYTPWFKQALDIALAAYKGEGGHHHA